MRLLLVRLPRPPRANALHYAAFKLHWHDIALLTAAPHSGEALGAAGNSTLWASLSAQTPAGLEHLNAAQALEFAQTLETQQEGAMRAALGGDDGGDRTQQHCLARAAGLPPEPCRASSRKTRRNAEARISSASAAPLEV